MGVPFDEPLSPTRATEHLRRMAGYGLDLHWTRHAKNQMDERGLIMGDVLYVLKHGFVYDDAKPATQEGCFKYCMECKTPNSGGRTVIIVVIPSTANAMKVVTVMWKDDH